MVIDRVFLFDAIFSKVLNFGKDGSFNIRLPPTGKCNSE